MQAFERCEYNAAEWLPHAAVQLDRLEQSWLLFEDRYNANLLKDPMKAVREWRIACDVKEGLRSMVEAGRVKATIYAYPGQLEWLYALRTGEVVDKLLKGVQ